MKSILVLFLAVACAIPHPTTLKQEWNEYKESFGKFYTSEKEDERRLNKYMETKERVEEHNRKYERGETSFKMGINEFTDWFPEELNGLNCAKFDENLPHDDAESFKLTPGAVVPKEINWVEKGAVTSVKNQGSCGSCYAFSAIGALEGLMYLTNKTITDLSPQEFVDCTSSYGNNGCNGGYTFECFRYVADRKGISSEKSYPYEAKKSTCRAKNGTVAASATGYVRLPQEEDKLMEAVGTVGPVSFLFGVGGDFYYYKDGVFDGDCLNGTKVNHAMLAVGYGKDKTTGKDYWLVKNSWGTKWGDKGYYKIIRGKGKCGLHLHNFYPVYKK